ncbi:Methenyltetrahydrofolate synthase domain-containing protein [Fukomys damarensis]|uniref:Methenyltetrahydrofolate synthase domain-containing protein n=1 Tax=Fukomys damarensis TaxID=885580 RepID=A0A091E9G0_FUKDA|nr:Methenyltetrahydrofolate synthase domain-containing protein [Fukomys damarensis]
MGTAAEPLLVPSTLPMVGPDGVSKQEIREQIWNYMEAHGVADFPRPVHHRIPNFKGSHLASQNIQGLDAFAGAQEVKVDPDKPLEGVRLLALQSQKTLLVPTPRLRTGLFNRITPPSGATTAELRRCATAQGVRNFSVPVGLDSSVHVDLVVVGSVAVSEKGWRIGKGEGYADLEYAMMVSMGAVREGTPVVTTVHDCQVLDFPEALLEDHDLTVDYILTPTRVIATGCERPKPAGITWSKIYHQPVTRLSALHHCPVPVTQYLVPIAERKRRTTSVSVAELHEREAQASDGGVEQEGGCQTAAVSESVHKCVRKVCDAARLVLEGKVPLSPTANTALPSHETVLPLLGPNQEAPCGVTKPEAWAPRRDQGLPQVSGAAVPAGPPLHPAAPAPITYSPAARSVLGQSLGNHCPGCQPLGRIGSLSLLPRQ